MTFALYLVCGRRKYRGHEPGTRFEAQLEPIAELRAVRRGDIKVLERITPRIRDGSYTFPQGWLPPPEPDATPVSTEAPQGASSIPRR